MRRMPHHPPLAASPPPPFTRCGDPVQRHREGDLSPISMGEYGHQHGRAWDTDRSSMDADRSSREKLLGLGQAIDASASDGYLVHIRRTEDQLRRPHRTKSLSHLAQCRTVSVKEPPAPEETIEDVKDPAAAAAAGATTRRRRRSG